MRAREDPDYISMLTDIRMGKASKGNIDFSLLQTRHLFSMPAQFAAEAAAAFHDAPIIVPTNEARHCFNRIILARRSKQAPNYIIRMDAELSKRGPYLFIAFRCIIVLSNQHI